MIPLGVSGDKTRSVKMMNVVWLLLGLFLLALLWNTAKMVLEGIEMMFEDMGKILSVLGEILSRLAVGSYRLSSAAYARLKR